ncbi:retroviral-like aspartic protease family protein [Saccharothrix mutabilis]
MTSTPSGHPVVPVGVGTQAPLPFLVDTGASGTVLDEAAVPLDSPGPDPVESAVHGALGVADPQRRVVGTVLRLGGWTTERMEVTVLPLDTLSAQVGTPLGGVLGLDVLALGVLELDLARWTLTLSVQDHRVRRPGTFDGESPIHRGPRDLVLLAAEVNGVEVTALLDTGAAVSVLNRVAGKAAGLAVDPMGGAAYAAGIGAGRTEVTRTRITEVRMGSIVLPGAVVTVADLPVLSVLELDQVPALLLGTDLLSGHVVVIDFPASRMYVTREGMR